MKKTFLLFSTVLFVVLYANGQNRNATVKILNNYIEYSNANITALKAVEHTLGSYNSLFNGYLRKDRKLGGEEYEKPKPSPFFDEDVFTINEDNPDYLYAVALKESAALPVAVRTELNNSMKAMHLCSQKLVKILDSMSNIFSGPLITVTDNEAVLPYNLLAEGKRQLQESGRQRDILFTTLVNYYHKACPLNYSSTDYIRSVNELKKGMVLCQNMLDDLSRNDSTRLTEYGVQLDSLCQVLDKNELALLKGIKPYGDSKHFPNKGYYHGMDLYSRYENLLDQFYLFAGYPRKFREQKGSVKSASGKCHYFYKQWLAQFNAPLGPVYCYNEYVLLIGGGKMKILSQDVSRTRYIYRGWGDENNSLPLRPLLSWMKETPRFEITWPEK